MICHVCWIVYYFTAKNCGVKITPPVLIEDHTMHFTPVLNLWCYSNTFGCYFNTLWCYAQTIGCNFNTWGCGPLLTTTGVILTPQLLGPTVFKAGSIYFDGPSPERFTSICLFCNQGISGGSGAQEAHSTPPPPSLILIDYACLSHFCI